MQLFNILQPSEFSGFGFDLPKMADEPQISFVDLMSLAPLRTTVAKATDTYISRTPSYGPGGGSAYGGHVFAQAVWAASQMVNLGMVVHVSLFCIF